ncbi:MAG: biosynthetic-type acetolactate synthase large subunit [Planctomycetota bacterium]|nr:biosynthetic-type acetolactate synthase large subunit [Planctomycetota bacterium]
MPAKTVAQKETRMTGARLLLEVLRRLGIKVIFGYPGGATIPIYDELYSFPEVRHILVRHEQGAAHMADGYYRASGKLACCMATSGPGATNLVTGLATAFMDSIPMLAITGQVKSHLIGNDAFQEADVTGITRPVTKHNYLVKSVNDLPRVLKEAAYIAMTGRPGPVLVDVPKDVQEAQYAGPLDVPMDLPGYRPPNGEPTPDQKEQVRAAAEAINAAERPVFYVGGGCVISGAYKELRACAERANIPVTTTLMALGAFPGNHTLSLGMLGMHGTSYANFAVNDCDALISIGARFDDRITGRLDRFSTGSKKIHFDIDPTCIGKNVKTRYPVLGDVRTSLKLLFKHLEHQDRKPWFDELNKQKREHPLTYPGEDLQAQYVIDRICEITRGRAIVATDVGQHQMWAAQFYTFVEPRHFLTSGGLGTMGYGLPAAIGAQMACPDEEVWCISGDGSIIMNIQELVTGRRLRTPVKVAILNNFHLGMVRQWQEMFYKEQYSEVDLSDNPDFAKVAEAFGCAGFTCKDKDRVDEVLKEARKVNDRPVIVDFHCVHAANVYPMIPAGASLDQIVHYPKEPELI